MGKRGAELMVRCEKCGRLVRRDKAVFIDKVMLSNPLERKDVHDEQYTRVISREVAYCPSCGKHGRIYEKKKRMMERQKERNFESQYRVYSPPKNSYAPQPMAAAKPVAKKVEPPASDAPRQETGQV